MKKNHSVILGVDVGGTFTDFLLWENGTVKTYKRPSSSEDPSQSVLDGILELAVTPDLIVHGTTVATNAVLEHRGVKTALISTVGTRDLLIIGRQTRSNIYELEPVTREPLVSDELRLETSARLDINGEIVESLDVEDTLRLIKFAKEKGSESIAISLLYSYINPILEEQIAQLFRQYSDMYLSTSNQISPEYREVERTQTTVLNSYIGPVMSRYIEKLSFGLEDLNAGPLRIVQSDGGSADGERASKLPVATLLSGPAAGVAGAFQIAKKSGFEKIITFDMGGTSTDVSLCDGEIPTRSDLTIDGLSARTPVVDVHTVGAGGGSIARIDKGGALRVGPESAGAIPGPASYGSGNSFTVTDAQVVLGRLGETGLLDGAMLLDRSRAEKAGNDLQKNMGSIEQLAESVIAVALANMEAAVRVVSIQRGYDPREFALVAFGGAGPLHACELAEALKLPRILIPLAPGVLAAQGAVYSDLTATRKRSVLQIFESSNHIKLHDSLKQVGDEVTREPGLTNADLIYAFDMRYVGQSYELSINVSLDKISDVESKFHKLHQQRFAHSDVNAAIEIVNVVATAIVQGKDSDVTEYRDNSLYSQKSVSSGSVWFSGKEIETAMYHRSSLSVGQKINGPALINQLDTTSLVAPGWVATVDDFGNLILERE